MAEARSRARAGKPRVFRVGPKTPEEVTRAARSRGVELAPAYYGTRQGQARALAFTVSGLASLEQLDAVKRSLDEAIARGDSFTAWRKSVLRGEVTLTLPDHRLELIWRNNLQNAYARGNGAWQLDHADSHPFLLYDAVNDTRTRPAHARMDGTIKPVGDSWWSSHYPPNGHNCRCRVIALTEEMAQEMGGVKPAPDDGQPDPGWEYDPRVDPTAALKKAVTRARSKLPRQLANKLGPLDGALAAGASLGRAPVQSWQDAVELGRKDLDAMLDDLAVKRDGVAGFARDRANAEILRRRILERFGEEEIIGDGRYSDVTFMLRASDSREDAAAWRRTQAVVQNSLPASWIRAAQADGISLRVRGTEGRAHYDGFNEAGGPVMLTDAADSTALHEFAHYLQHKLPELDRLFQAYATHRVTGSPLTSLRDLTGWTGYRPNELTRPDALWNPYAGKWYDPYVDPRRGVPFGYLEMMPMLVEMLADTGALQTLLTKGDLEALELLLGILRGWRP